MAVPNARFFGAQHGADLHWSCADVLRVSHRNPCRRKRKVRCAACRHREKSATFSCVIDANFGKILRMFDVGRVRFRHSTRQKLDADILRRQNVFAATPAEVLVRCASTAQRILHSTISPIFYRKIYAIAPLSARFFRCATRRRLALELR